MEGLKGKVCLPCLDCTKCAVWKANQANIKNGPEGLGLEVFGDAVSS